MKIERLNGAEEEVPEDHQSDVRRGALIIDGEKPHGKHGDEVHHCEVMLEGVELEQSEDYHWHKYLLLMYKE